MGHATCAQFDVHLALFLCRIDVDGDPSALGPRTPPSRTRPGATTSFLRSFDVRGPFIQRFSFCGHPGSPADYPFFSLIRRSGSSADFTCNFTQRNQFLFQTLSGHFQFRNLFE